MKYHKSCEYCGHRISAYTIGLNQSQISAFSRFAAKYLENGRKPLLKPAIGLSNAQYTNFHNLVYFGIIFKAPEHDGWYLTELGEKFYYGETDILTPAGFMGGQALSEEHEAWKTHDKPRKLVNIRDLMPLEWKKRPQYQQEKSNQISMI